MKLPKEIEKEMEAINAGGISARIENRGRHLAIMIGPIMAGILPRGANSKKDGIRASLNIRSQMRRAARELTAQK